MPLPFKTMHLVFLNQYYPPDAAPTGVMLAAVAEELAAQGHEVTVICAEGGYANVERRTSNVEHPTTDGRAGFTHPADLSPSARGKEGSPKKNVDPAIAGRPSAEKMGHLRKGAPTVLRIRATRFGRGTFLGKVVDYLSYYVGVAWRLAVMRPRPERIVALTTPPYLSVFGAGDVEVPRGGSCALGDGLVSGCDGGARDAAARRCGAPAAGGLGALGLRRQALCGVADLGAGHGGEGSGIGRDAFRQGSHSPRLRRPPCGRKIGRLRKGVPTRG